MTEPSIVERLYFGHDEAEQDMANGLLRAGFLQTAAYNAAVSGRKMLIIGRKGSGKSAICMHLAEQGAGAGAAGGGSAGWASVLITPDDAAGDEIRQFELQGLTGDTAKSVIWRYVFALHAARHLVEHARDAHGEKPNSVKQLRKFLRDNGELPSGRLADLAEQGRRRMQTTGLQLGAFGVQIGVDRTLAEPSEGTRAGRQLEILEEAVARAFDELRCAATHPPLLLLVDQLEKVWSAQADANSMVIGLLLAAKEAAVKYPGAVRALVFLRSDIYDSLTFGEGDKFRSYELRIDWPETLLRRLALSRAQASLQSGLSEDQLWHQVFPRQVRGEETAAYLFSRTLPRPRDAIQYLNACRDRAEYYGRERITEDDVIEAGQQFSEWKLKDLVQEYLVAHPFLQALLELYRNAGYVVTRTATGHRLLAVREEMARQYPAYTESFTPEAVIGVLYSVGFLGVRRGTEIVYAGGFAPPVQPDEKEFHIHPCFREALRAREAVPVTPWRPALRIAGSSWGGVSHTRREIDLAANVVRSCDLLLRRIGRAGGLPDTTRQEVAQQLQRLHQETQDALDDRLGPENSLLRHADEHTRSVITYLRGQAAALRDSGLEDREGEAGAQALARELADQAADLEARLGGFTGSSGLGGSSG
ncbi:P-loop ATPase, Sll1717 family [Streptomyces sp. NPDC050418]|uniref:P-loop ATPase, Sll1717 family n=1 Tax=Streptomyces sp. NPDC050418 TaxID=3365612 RepID=UPI0037A52E59